MMKPLVKMLDPAREPVAPRRRRRLQWPVRIALAALGVLVIVAVLAPVLAPHDPMKSFGDHVLSPPGGAFPFGTDELGRDQVSRIFYGARASLWIGALTTAAALGAGTLLALAATLGGTLIDTVLMRVTDMLLAFPGLLLALAVVAVLGPGLTQALTAVAISLIPGYVRTVRSYILGVRERDYVKAAAAMGGGRLRIAIRHVLPNIAGGLTVLATLGIALVTLEVSALSFVGLGAQPPAAEWGSMLATAREYITTAWWLTLVPAVTIIVLVLSVNVVGDWLRDVLDPRGRA